MKCSSIQRILGSAHSSTGSEKVRLHLSRCEKCRQYAEKQRLLLLLLHLKKGETRPEGAAEKTSAHIHAAVVELQYEREHPEPRSTPGLGHPVWRSALASAFLVMGTYYVLTSRSLEPIDPYYAYRETAFERRMLVQVPGTNGAVHSELDFNRLRYGTDASTLVHFPEFE